jgi:hypothetical protein
MEKPPATDAHRTKTAARGSRSAHGAAAPAKKVAARPVAPPVQVVDEAPAFVAPQPENFTITHELSITGPTADALWDAYLLNFGPLGELAMLPHLYSRDEVLDELANPRITKIVGWRDDEPIGLAMVTNSLDDVPQISPRFLRDRYPQHAERDTIYYGILVMVSSHVRGRTLFSRLYTELWQVAALASGVLIFDICDFNRTMFNTDVLTQRIADNFPRSSVQVLDRQTWYAAELPEALPTPNDR